MPSSRLFRELVIRPSFTLESKTQKTVENRDREVIPFPSPVWSLRESEYLALSGCHSQHGTTEVACVVGHLGYSRWIDFFEAFESWG